MFTIINEKLLNEAVVELHHLSETLPGHAGEACGDAVKTLHTALFWLDQYQKGAEDLGLLRRNP